VRDEQFQQQELMRTQMRPPQFESDSDQEGSEQLDAELVLQQDSLFFRYSVNNNNCLSQ